MGSAVTVVLVGLGVVVIAAAVVIGLGRWRWSSATTRLAAELLAGRAPTEKQTVSFQDLEGLPEPVIRYFRFALREGQPLVRSVRLEQEGTFRVGESEQGWRPFHATQWFATGPPGFVWDARIRVAPFFPIHVRDAYVTGQGSMTGALVSVIPVVNERGRAELDSGALQRYLAEAAWFPTALLPSQGVEWSPIDATRALATIQDGPTTASLEFRFGSEGEITGIYAPGRYREVRGEYVPTPWEGRYWAYEVHDGMRIPTEGEVGWILPGGRFPYWRGRTVKIDYEFDE